MVTPFSQVRSGSAFRRGFTLIELLVVMAIVAILATAAAMSLGGIMSSQHINEGAEVAQDIFNLGRRTAVAHSHIVEIRFFMCQDPSDATAAGSQQQWRAIQAVEMLDNGTEQAVCRPTILPNRLIMSTAVATSASAPPLLSPLLQKSLIFAPSGTGITPTNLGTITDYRRFRFMPDGSTDLPLFQAARQDAGQILWWVTLYNENDATRAVLPPPNYAAIQVDPFSGAVSILRPL